MVILQVPKALTNISVDTALVAYKNRLFAPATWREYLNEATEKFKDWFNKGSPLPFERSYQLI